MVLDKRYKYSYNRETVKKVLVKIYLPDLQIEVDR